MNLDHLNIHISLILLSIPCMSDLTIVLTGLQSINHMTSNTTLSNSASGNDVKTKESGFAHAHEDYIISHGWINILKTHIGDSSAHYGRYRSCIDIYILLNRRGSHMQCLIDLHLPSFFLQIQQCIQ